MTFDSPIPKALGEPVGIFLASKEWKASAQGESLVFLNLYLWHGRL